MTNDSPGLPFSDLPEPTLLPVAHSGGTHDGTRITEPEKAVILALYTQLKSVHAVARATGHGWKTVRAVCCPETSFKQVDAETMQLVKDMRHKGARYQQIAAETGLPRATIANIITHDPAMVKAIQETRAARLLVTEEMLMEAQAEAIEEKIEAGKLTPGDATNALMVNGVLHEKAGGSAPLRIRHEADPTFLAAAAMFSGAFKAKPVLPAESVQEAVVVSNNAELRQPETN